MHRWIPLFLIGMMVGWGGVPDSASAHVADPHPGIDVEHYTFRLTLEDATDRIRGEATVRLRLRSDTLTAVRLDLIGPNGDGTGMEVASVTRAGESVDFHQANNHLHLPLREAPEVDAEQTYTIRYAGVPADGLIISTNRHGDRTFFGDNWPNRARHWLPTVDHPSDKATVEFHVRAPARYEVVSNGALAADSVAGDTRHTHWSTDGPLPTKVMVIGVADFAVDTVGTVDGVPVQSWVYPEDRGPGFEDLGQAPPILQFYEDNIGPYPYEKLANVQSSTRYGGMENASAIFYSEAAVADGEDDRPLIAHELVHQWYGNTVTESDWPHLWLSEGFATYLSFLYLEDIRGAELLRQNMRSARERVVQFHADNPNEPLVDTTYADPNELLNTNPYQKGAWVLHMLRREVGTDTFWEGLRTYYQRYEDQNASTADFRRVMEDVSGQDLTDFFAQWTRRAGQPHVVGTWRYDADAGALVVDLEQVQDGAAFAFPLELGIDTGNGELRIETLDVQKREHTFTVDLAGAPADVQFDPDVWTLMEADFGPE